MTQGLVEDERRRRVQFLLAKFDLRSRDETGAKLMNRTVVAGHIVERVEIGLEEP